MAVFNKVLLSTSTTHTSPNIVYGIQFDGNSIKLLIPENTDKEHKNVLWLKSVLISALLRWTNIEKKQNNINSLSLIPADEYCFLYNELKNKYGKQLCEVGFHVL